MNEQIHKTINDNPDSLEIGTPAKGGAMKIYHNYEDVEGFKKKVDNAFEVRKYAQIKIDSSM